MKSSYSLFVHCVNPQERKPKAQRDWLDLLQGRAHNVHKVDVCALSYYVNPQERKRGGQGPTSCAGEGLYPQSRSFLLAEAGISV